MEAEISYFVSLVTSLQVKHKTKQNKTKTHTFYKMNKSVPTSMRTYKTPLFFHEIFILVKD